MMSACGDGYPRQPSLEEDLAAIAAFNERYLTAINDENIEALSSLTTAGHVMLAPNRAPLVGKAANDEANGRAFAQFDIDETWTPIETVVSGDLAFQRGTYTTAVKPKADKVAADTGVRDAEESGADATGETQDGPPDAAGGAAPDASREIRGNFLRIYQRQPNGAWRMTLDMFNTEGGR
jgi:ketosteroid isomerase-like protein